MNQNNSAMNSSVNISLDAAPQMPTLALDSMPLVPQSWGEIIDKITILEIKSEKLSDPAKLKNVRRELDELISVREQHFPQHDGLVGLAAKLKKVNESLWWIEDDIRDCERAKNFGSKFIELARAVYVTNDLRGDVKREINELLGSALVEEKSYAAYTDDQAAASAQLLAGAKAIPADAVPSVAPTLNTMAGAEALSPVQIDVCHGDLVTALIKVQKPKNLLELGFGSGYTTKKIIEALEWNESGDPDPDYGPPARFTMVDNWLDWGGQLPEAVKPFVGSRASVVQANEIGFVFSTKETYDFIFSDADHFNTDKWFDYVYDRLLNPNGILVYHDICESDPGPGRAWFPNLANILHRTRRLGIDHKLFKRQSRRDERCWRGLLVLFKHEQ